MTVFVKIRAGDVFGELADVAILPCDTNGELATFAKRTRERLKLPPPPPLLALGDLHAMPIVHARVGRLAYAVVRDERGSSVEVLHRVGCNMGTLAAGAPGIRVIASPLLGTGAGHVDLLPAISAVTKGFRETAPPDAVLSLCTPGADRLDELKAWYESWQPTQKAPPRVFISYAIANRRTAEWVAGLHEFLKGQGVDAVLDRWDLEATASLEKWMAGEFGRAEKVLIVSDEVYAQRANAGLGGVGYETALIAEDLRTDDKASKYVIVLLSGTKESGLPHYLQDRLALDCREPLHTARKYHEIWQRVCDVSPVGPALGMSPILLDE
jgi:hypothetical protein